MLLVLVAASFAAAQLHQATSDVLGAHLNYGRGCAACHAPHSGAAGNGALKTVDATTGDSILWGQDVGSLYNQTLTFAGNTVEQLPGSMLAGTPDVNGLLTCLSCHDGNYAQGAMMKNAVVETLPSTYGTYQKPPTLLGNNGADSQGANSYLSDHPVGLNAAVSCGGQWNWDCTEVNGVISMNGPNSGRFANTTYGWFVKLSAYNNTAVVTCTSCHNQHLMNTVAVTAKNAPGLTAGNYATMFFVLAPYNPASGTTGSNQTAQFCRQCHGGEANESNSTATIPTTF
jgi:hypothetical protein